MIEKWGWEKSYQTRINGKRRSQGRRLAVRIFEQVSSGESSVALRRWRWRRRGCYSSFIAQFHNEIRANLCLREDGRKKDKFALKWVQWRNGSLEGFLIVGWWRAKRQKWSAQRDLSNKSKITMMVRKNTQFSLNCKLPLALIKRIRNRTKLRRHYSYAKRNLFMI